MINGVGDFSGSPPILSFHPGPDGKRGDRPQAASALTRDLRPDGRCDVRRGDGSRRSAAAEPPKPMLMSLSMVDTGGTRPADLRK